MTKHESKHDSNNETNDEGRMPSPGAPVTSADDPRLTAYALDELDAADVAAVERYLAASPEARALVEETRAFAGVLSEGLAAEDTPGLAPEQRAVLSAALDADSGGQPGAPAAVRPINGSGRGRGRSTGSRGAVLRLWLTTAAALVLGMLTWRLASEGTTAVGDHALAPGAPVARLDEEAPAARPADAPGEQLVLEMYDVRDLVGKTQNDVGADYNLLPSGTAGSGPANDLEAPVLGDDPVVSEEAAGLARDDLDAESLGEELVAIGRQGGGGGGSRIDSVEAKRLIEGHRPPGGGSGRFYVQDSDSSAGLPVASAEPSPARAAPTEPLVLEALGYLDGSVTDADDDRYASGHWRKRPQTLMAGGESYAPIHENPFQPLTRDRYSALSTFGIDVDTASYSNARRFLNRNQAPPPDAVRLEEFINAFDYDLPAPDGEHPFSVSIDAASAPWAPRHRLVRIGLQGMEFDRGERPASNLVFLLDVSGSMKDQDKLPLLVASLKLLVAELDADDRVAIVTYASGTRLALPSTSGADEGTILAALDALTANGSTNASDGIQDAYRVAVENFVEGGTNRVLLATDGDFNVGITEDGPLETFIADKARSGVFLTVLGFGTGNLKDSKAEILADRGNGNYAYIDNLNEAHKVLVREMGGTLVTIAKDVKLQVEFNPGRVAAYRLLGYENRALAPQDFRDDRKDAGEIGAGHSVTALYEVVPVGVEGLPGAVELKYQAAPPEPEVVVDSPELLTVNLRYKLPDEDEAHEFAVPFVDDGTGFASASEDFRFAAAVASFGMVLRHSAHRGDVDLATIYEWAADALGEDPHGDRAEFLRLVRNAQGLPGY